jgi:hypothetical protein
LEEDQQRVSFVLTSSTNVNKLLTMLKTTHSAVHIETMLVSKRENLLFATHSCCLSFDSRCSCA